MKQSTSPPPVPHRGGTAPLLDVHDLFKTYLLGRVKVPVLRGVSVAVRPGEFVAVLGASGSGKSTLLHLMGGLDRADRRRYCPSCAFDMTGLDGHACPECATTTDFGSGGGITFDGRDVRRFSGRELDRYRNQDVGFIFQFYHLLPELTVVENVLIGSMVRYGRFGYMARSRSCREKAQKLLDQVGLSHRLKHRPAELSGGERQRVAIARALINEPRLLLADEPTGNLDHETGGRILDMMMEIRRERSQTMVVVTHDEETAKRADRIVRLLDGRIVAG